MHVWRSVESSGSRLTVLETDRELLRALVRRLAEEGPEADRRGPWSWRWLRAIRQSRAGFSRHCVALRWSGMISTYRVRVSKDEGSTYDARSPRIVDALPSGGRLALTHAGGHRGGRAFVKHHIKVVDRLLGKRHLHREQDGVNGALARTVLGGVARPVISSIGPTARGPTSHSSSKRRCR